MRTIPPGGADASRRWGGVRADSEACGFQPTVILMHSGPPGMPTDGFGTPRTRLR
ncbi:MAG: hypothetical protein QOE03_4131, partial [Micromonosporaceae bacterium]|nr:hypothetical protein [Micromonosporaceae bacterium]